jgi:hypothetical protein
MRRFAVLLFLLLLGCAGTPPQPERGFNGYSKERATMESYRMDSGHCQADVGAASNQIRNGADYHDCMNGKGWIRVS